MEDTTNDPLMAARRPLASLISKSEKAHEKLAPGTWQHAMLRDNLKALRIASTLMDPAGQLDGGITRDELEEALGALASMMSKTEKAQSTFEPGTPHHTLQRNRLHALRTADEAIRAELDRR